MCAMRSFGSQENNMCILYMVMHSLIQLGLHTKTVLAIVRVVVGLATSCSAMLHKKAANTYLFVALS